MDWQRLLEVPALREEYDNYALVQFIPLSIWENIAGTIGNAEADTYVRVLADSDLSLAEANELEDVVVNLHWLLPDDRC